MACFQGRAHISKVGLRTPSPALCANTCESQTSQGASQILDAISILLAAPVAHHEGGDRAPKRRKNDDGASVAVLHTQDGPSESVVLARISVDLVSTLLVLVLYHA